MNGKRRPDYPRLPANVVGGGWMRWASLLSIYFEKKILNYLTKKISGNINIFLYLWGMDANKEWMKPLSDERRTLLMDNIGGLDDFMAIKHENDVQNWSEHMMKMCDTLQEEKRMLEAKILTFRLLLKQTACGEEWIHKYDEHFDIVKYRHGQEEKEG